MFWTICYARTGINEWKWTKKCFSFWKVNWMWCYRWKANVDAVAVAFFDFGWWKTVSGKANAINHYKQINYSIRVLFGHNFNLAFEITLYKIHVEFFRYYLELWAVFVFFYIFALVYRLSSLFRIKRNMSVRTFFVFYFYFSDNNNNLRFFYIIFISNRFMRENLHEKKHI